MLTLPQAFAEIDREYPLDGRPVRNLLALAHGGSRSVEARLEASGYHVRRMHLQAHWHDADFCAALLASGAATVIAVRDPVMVALSTIARDDDTLDAVIRHSVEFFALDWSPAVEIIPVELTPELPLIGALDYQDKTDYLAGDLAGIWQRQPNLAAALPTLETACRAKMTALGYALPWWSA